MRRRTATADAPSPSRTRRRRRAARVSLVAAGLCGLLGASTVDAAAVTLGSPPMVDGSTTATNISQRSSELGFNAADAEHPHIRSVSPSSGSTRGGLLVTITGENFEGTTGVSFGSTRASIIQVASDDLIRVVTPASSAGTVDVWVRTPVGVGRVMDAFTFVARGAPKTVKCVVPRLKGKTLKKARKLLKKAHCRLGKINGPKGKNARIKKQKPKPGTVLNPGSKVRVTAQRPHR